MGEVDKAVRISDDCCVVSWGMGEVDKAIRISDDCCVIAVLF